MQKCIVVQLVKKLYLVNNKLKDESIPEEFWELGSNCQDLKWKIRVYKGTREP